VFFYSHFQILLLVIIYSAMLLVFITYVKMLREGKASTYDLLLTSTVYDEKMKGFSKVLLHKFINTFYRGESTIIGSLNTKPLLKKVQRRPVLESS
jgi:hypothetical protein